MNKMKRLYDQHLPYYPVKRVLNYDEALPLTKDMPPYIVNWIGLPFPENGLYVFMFTSEKPAIWFDDYHDSNKCSTS